MLIYAKSDFLNTRMVILNNVTVFIESDDFVSSEDYNAKTVAARLSAALGKDITTVKISSKETDSYTRYSDLATLAKEKAKSAISL